MFHFHENIGKLYSSQSSVAGLKEIQRFNFFFIYKQKVDSPEVSVKSWHVYKRKCSLWISVYLRNKAIFVSISQPQVPCEKYISFLPWRFWANPQNLEVQDQECKHINICLPPVFDITFNPLKHTRKRNISFLKHKKEISTFWFSPPLTLYDWTHSVNQRELWIKQETQWQKADPQTGKCGNGPSHLCI